VNRERVFGGLAIGIVAALGVYFAVRDGTEERATDSESEPREYGVLESLPTLESVPESDVEFGAVPASPTAERARRDTDRPSPDELARVEEANSNKVFGRPAAPFDPKKLIALGFSDSHVNEIRSDFLGFKDELEAQADGERVKSPVELTPQEREERRRAREEIMPARDFDAALYATRQRNRIRVEGLREDSPPWQAGLRPGDQILAIDGMRVFDTKDFRDGREAAQEGDVIELVILRGNDKLYDVWVPCCTTQWGNLRMVLAPPLSEERGNFVP